MEINDSKKNDVSILELVGRLDAASFEALKGKISAMIDAGERKFLIDCYRLEYISSAGLRVFYHTSHRLESLEGKVAFCALHPNVKKVFDMVEMGSDFAIYTSKEEAIAAF